MPVTMHDRWLAPPAAPPRPAPPSLPFSGVGVLQHATCNPAVPAERRIDLLAVINTIISRMTPAAVGRVDELVRRAFFHPDAAALVRKARLPWQGNAGIAGGWVCGERTLHALYGGAPYRGGLTGPLMPRGGEFGHVLAHELGHVCDSAQAYSESPGWRRAWEREIAGGQLTARAAVDPEEGLAEVFALLHAADTPSGTIGKAFPRALEFLDGAKLLPPERPWARGEAERKAMLAVAAGIQRLRHRLSLQQIEQETEVRKARKQRTTR